MPGITLSSSSVRINIHSAQPNDIATMNTADTPTYHTHAIDHIQVPLPSHHAAETDALFTATQMPLMLLSDTSNASGAPKLPPISSIARLILLELLPTRLSKSEPNHVWSLSLVLLEVPPGLLMLPLSDAWQ